MSLSAVEKLHVTIGMVKIGRPGQSLNAILGSCIGIGFLSPDKSLFGLAHCLLSNFGKVSKQSPGRNIDAAIQTLCEKMEICDEERRAVQVVLAGGANMTLPEGTDPKRLVGSVNANYAPKALKGAGFRVRHQDLGGTFGRQFTIDCDTGAFDISLIPRLEGNSA